MSRRNKLADIFTDTSRELAAANLEENKSVERVLAGPVRSMGLALDRMDQEAKALQEALEAGERVVEIDAELIDGSFVRDRIDSVVRADDDLVRSVEENGQEVPILVRPHPELAGRYQVAYGHRRLQAVRFLKRKVRAIVRPLTDSDLVVAQGIENTARQDLSYIERAIFALNLEGRGFGRDVIMQALSTDKTELSKLLSVAKNIPDGLVTAIGAAPSAGRRRWMELAERLADGNAIKTVHRLIAMADFGTASSDERFVRVLGELSKKTKVQSDVTEWKSNKGDLSAKIKDKGKAYTLSLKSDGVETGFGQYLTARLDEIYADWCRTRDTKTE